MIPVRLPDRTLGIVFVHQRETVPVPSKDWNILKPTHRVERRTKCEIVEIDSIDAKKWKPIGLPGVSKCHPKDNFVKETGRKLSLCKAMMLSSGAREVSGHKWRFSKFERTEIWKAYLNRAVDPEIIKLEEDIRKAINDRKEGTNEVHVT